MCDNTNTNKRHESWYLTTTKSVRSHSCSSPIPSSSTKESEGKYNSCESEMQNQASEDVTSDSDHMICTLEKNVKLTGAIPKKNTVQQVEKTLSPPIASVTKKLNDNTSAGNEKTVELIAGEKVKSVNVVQTGMDRYILVKRKPSPLKGNIKKISKSDNGGKTDNPLSKNRFAALSTDDQLPNSDQSELNRARPPPIYLRERSSNDLVKNITSVIGTSTFHVVPLLKGKIHETKVQTYNEKSFREITNYFNTVKKSYYTYQLKSSKGLAVVIKGIESEVNPSEVKCALESQGFNIRSVINIFNRDKVPQPMFKVELEPDTRKLKRNEVHPIYNLQYLLHRRISVDEPHKRRGPVQCLNCQEYGHTKTYCVLQTVCVVCGDLHQSSTCSKKAQEEKKCSNCGGNHTANYRGCPIYKNLKQKYNERLKTVREGAYSPPVLEIRSVPAPLQNIPNSSVPFGSVSYANILKPIPQQSSTFPVNGMESLIQQLSQSMNMFMSTMQSMLQNLIESQNRLIQAFISKK